MLIGLPPSSEGGRQLTMAEVSATAAVTFLGRVGAATAWGAVVTSSPDTTARLINTTPNRRLASERKGLCAVVTASAWLRWRCACQLPAVTLMIPQSSSPAKTATSGYSNQSPRKPE